ncbi:hypothetical protein A9174_10805 [Mesorhizobium loti NZP2037]|nr:hypothetical protein [Mesorhizobium loti]ANN57202.1 hypothetical protein A9174_10805 [Mesorhizobium loti NZP2037]
MLDRPIRSHNEGFYPSDLKTLKLAFDALCVELNVLPDTTDAQAVAAELIRLFQTGMTSGDRLIIAARGRWREEWKIAG